MNQELSVKIQESTIRKPYAAPALVNYGSVRNLTQSGGASPTENATGGGNGGCSGNGRKSCSELRVKENIVRIGDHPFGFGLFLFNYRSEYRDQWGHGRQFGVMIDEVEAIVPESVSLHADGFKRVDYAMLGIDRPVH